jgi:nitrate/TMAO reductase-like tetraheme cytochrome c subunit
MCVGRRRDRALSREAPARPRRRRWRYALAAAAGLLLFVGAVGGFTSALDATNSLGFCISCHDMQKNYEEYKKTVHYNNKAGVRAVCSDCHVPKKNWFAEMERKLEAAEDVWGEVLGVIDTPEKFEARRAQMARAEWARMKASDSIGCRNCHSFESMDLDQQDKSAGRKHARAMAAGAGKTCIDCHKGIAHELPKITDGDDKDG